MSDEVIAELRREIDALRARVFELEGAQRAGSEAAAPATRIEDARVSRRNLLGKAGAVAAAGVAGAVVGSGARAQPAGAVNGDPLILGGAAVNECTFATALLIHNYEDAYGFAVLDTGGPNPGLGYISAYSRKRASGKNMPAFRGDAEASNAFYGTATNVPALFGTCTGSAGVQGNCTGDGPAGVIGASTTTTGVWGLAMKNGIGVLAQSTGGPGVDASSSSGYGVHAVSGSSYGVYGESTSSYGVRGRSSNSTGVRGETSGSGATGVHGISGSGAGVLGQATSGPGVYGAATSGDAIRAVGGTGRGLYATADGQAAVEGAAVSGPGVTGTSSSGYGVWGDSQDLYGVQGTSENSIGVFAVSTHDRGLRATSGGREAIEAIGKSYGATFQGKSAAVKLVPQTTAGKPTSGSHARGELLCDKDGVLWFCTAGGLTGGTWKKVSLV
ncbi:MAG: hypothetical protein JO291_14510 [Acidimicrobiia bacterium]|nr:hypothetical protein [Acidimicrobiia bacterium]